MKTKSLLLTVASFLTLVAVREARAVDGPLPLRYAAQGVALYNGVTTQAIETAYGSNLLGLPFTGTTTYDFYSTPLLAAVWLPTSVQGKGIICMQNTSPTSANDFKVTGQMRYYDYNSVTGTDTLIVDTGTSEKDNVKGGRMTHWKMHPVHLPANYTMPAGDLLHVAVTVTLVSGNPGTGAQVLYNGPKGSTTIADVTYAASDNHGGPLIWSLAPVTVALPAIFSIYADPDPGVRLTCLGKPGECYCIQATTNLNDPSSWATIGTNTCSTNVLSVLVDPMNYPCRFYRAMAP